MYYQTVPLYAGGSTVGESGAWYQMTFYLNGRYYLGWIPKAEYGKVRLSMDTTEQLLADGVYSNPCPPEKQLFFDGRYRKENCPSPKDHRKRESALYAEA
ncbi:MAG: hypothetical protein ACLR6B_09800 [Blautia sp.]